jgi:N utilization substance protein B
MPNESKPNQTTPNVNISTPSARRNARCYALQAMYQWQLSNAPVSDIEQEFLRYHIEKKTDLDYFKELIRGIPENREDLDREIKNYLGKRALTEVDPIELSVLRLAIYELLKRPDVPYRVIINEALELTKKFGSVEGFKFVNGILDRVAKKNRAVEIDMKKSQE